MSSLNETVSAERIHIGFFGQRNTGKSSVVNAVTGQKLSLVSEVKGTTTDPVQKAMELLPLGPVVIIDTPGIDDEGTLGEMRVQRARQVLDKTDVAVLVVDGTIGMREADRELCELFAEKKIPYIIAYNKSDLCSADGESKAACSTRQETAGSAQMLAAQQQFNEDTQTFAARMEADGRAQTSAAEREADESTQTSAAQEIYVSALNGTNIYELKEMIGCLAGQAKNEKTLVGDLLSPQDIVILVTPIDAAAPKGRMILPQQQVIRDVLDHDAVNVVVKETELLRALGALKERPKLVITDSQAFGRVSKETPEDILLTSFSILFARYKGDLEEAVRGAAALDRLQDGDTVLISEGCSHHRQCGDIGTEKLPRWITEYTKKKLQFAFTLGREFPQDVTPYAAVVHCGGCMLNEREMKSRIARCVAQGVPVTNYGIAIAQLHGILRRSLSPFPQAQALLDV